MWELFIISIVIVGILLWFKHKIPFWKGQIGENFVARKLKKLNPDRYRLLNDLLLSSQSSLDTTQVDHVVVSNYGIFCIETKSYKGWIFGNARQEYWTQVIYRNKTRFYNPLRQNYAHIKAIEMLIKSLYPNVPIMSFVVFPYADKLEISGTDSVGYVQDIVNKISSFNTQVLSDTDRDRIYKTLINANIQDKAARKLHEKDVRNLIR